MNFKLYSKYNSFNKLLTSHSIHHGMDAANCKVPHQSKTSTLFK